MAWSTVNSASRSDATGVQLGEVGVGGKATVKDQLSGQLTRTLLPEINKFQNGVVLRCFGNGSTAVDEDPLLGLPGY